MADIQFLTGDCRERLAGLPAKSVHTCVTSPPYFGLRDYGVDGQIGLESTPDAFVAELVKVFREVRRVLRDDGTLWLNLGDSYASAPGQATRGGLEGNGHRSGGPNLSKLSRVGSSPKAGQEASDISRRPFAPGLKPKDLMGIPWRVAFALQADGWFLRQDIIWSKSNPMPESVTDRCTKSHEYLFLLAKSAKYYYDAEAIKEARTQAEDANTFRGGCYIGGETDNATMGKRRTPGNKTHKAPDAYARGDDKHRTKAGLLAYCDREREADPNDLGTRNKRSVWTVGSAPFKEAHFATYPPKLIEPCILAGCPEFTCAKCGTALDSKLAPVPTCPRCKADLARIGAIVPGTVLDCFGGAGTTGLVADRLQRNAILIELNPAYAEIAKRRLNWIEDLI
jgi:DNA modification methylase